MGPSTRGRLHDLVGAHEQRPGEAGLPVGCGGGRGDGVGRVEPPQVRPAAGAHRHRHGAQPAGGLGERRPQGAAAQQRQHVAVAVGGQRPLGVADQALRREGPHPLQHVQGDGPRLHPGVGLEIHPVAAQHVHRDDDHVLGPAGVQAHEARAEVQRAAQHAGPHPVQARVVGAVGGDADRTQPPRERVAGVGDPAVQPQDRGHPLRAQPRATRPGGRAAHVRPGDHQHLPVGAAQLRPGVGGRHVQVVQDGGGQDHLPQVVRAAHAGGRCAPRGCDRARDALIVQSVLGHVHTVPPWQPVSTS